MLDVHTGPGADLPVVLYGCETWSLTLREKHRLRATDNGLLRRIFRHKRREIIGEWRKLGTEELHYLYLSPNVIKQMKSSGMRCAGYITYIGEERKVHTIFVAKSEIKNPLGRLGGGGGKWDVWIRMDLREIVWGSGVD
jgi:hypothetical protein